MSKTVVKKNSSIKRNDIIAVIMLFDSHIEAYEFGIVSADGRTVTWEVSLSAEI